MREVGSRSSGCRVVRLTQVREVGSRSSGCVVRVTQVREVGSRSSAASQRSLSSCATCRVQAFVNNACYTRLSLIRDAVNEQIVACVFVLGSLI